MFIVEHHMQSSPHIQVKSQRGSLYAWVECSRNYVQKTEIENQNSMRTKVGKARQLSKIRSEGKQRAGSASQRGRMEQGGVVVMAKEETVASTVPVFPSSQEKGNELEK